MANKRNLKKEINFIAEELIADCLLSKAFVSGNNDSKTDELIGRIFDIKEDFLARINKTDGKNDVKLVRNYYRSLITNFDKKAGEIIAEIEKLNQ
ncbi:MAG: hypothetical protein RR293_02410 [Bacteroidales bacterium]